jgi:short-subunit dehydrogenase
MPSMDVAQMGYRGLRANQRVVITGTRNLVLANVVPLLPRRAVLKLVHNLQSPA